MDVDRLFRLYAETRAPEPLARVFDACAPRLLSVAIHLVGDAQKAEDLVQDAFLTAIERAAEYDPERPVEPWLLGILSRSARRVWRHTAREVDPERLERRLAATPIDEAIGSELDGALAKALDRLDEPYREVLLLRLRHGLSPADIAHVVKESPGTVRVRLSRGLRKLRALLPAGFASVLAVHGGGGDVLVSVRDVVLQRAAELAPATVTTGGAAGLLKVLGGGVVEKGAWIGAGAVLAALGVTAVLVTGGGDGREGSGPAELGVGDVRPSSLAQGTETEPGREIDLARTEATPVSRRFPVESEERPATVPLAPVLVLDGHTGEPLAGVRIESHGPLESSYDELRVRAGPRWPGAATEYRPYGSTPLLLEEPTPLQRAGEVAVRYLDLPRERERPFHVATTGEDGRAETPAEGDRLLVFRAEGYGERHVPLREGEVLEKVELRRPRTLRGLVIDTKGERVHERLTFLLHGQEDTRWSSRQGEGTNGKRSFEGTWLVETDEDGELVAEIPAASVQARCQTPRYSTTRSGIHPENGSRWVFPMNFRPGEEEAPVWLVVRRCSWLRVVDQETGAPVERLTLQRFDPLTGSGKGASDVFAPGGEVRLDGLADPRINPDPDDLLIWSPEHEARRIAPAELLAEPPLEVRLRPGSLPALVVRVLDGGDPAEAAEVTLASGRRPVFTRSPMSDRVLVAARTDEEGRAELRAPGGSYLVEARVGESRVSRIVDLPHAGELRLDPVSNATLEVEVVTTLGRPAPGHLVVVTGPVGIELGARSGEQGLERFDELGPGAYRVVVSPAPVEMSFAGGHEQEVLLEPGQTLPVRFVVADPDQACRPRLVAERETSFEGWRMRGLATASWKDVRKDGTADVDLLELAVPALEVEDPDGLLRQVTYELDLYASAPEELPIAVRLDAPRYAGTLKGHDGTPLAGVGVTIAAPVGMTVLKTTTDRDGSFVLPVPPAAREPGFHLLFEGTRSAGAFTPYPPGSEYRFVVHESPTRSGTPLEVRLPVSSSHFTLRGVTDTPLEGRLVGRDGLPRAGVEVSLTAIRDEAQGELRVLRPSARDRTDDDGRFSVVVPVLERFVLTVELEEGESTKLDWRPTEFPTSHEFVVE